VTTTSGSPFATTHGVIDGVHRGTADLRSASEVTLSTGFAQFDVLMIGVAHATDRRPATDVHFAKLAGGQTHNRVLAFPSR